MTHDFKAKIRGSAFQFQAGSKAGFTLQNLGERPASPLPVFLVNVTAAAAGRLWTFFATKDPGQVRHQSGKTH